MTTCGWCYKRFTGRRGQRFCSRSCAGQYQFRDRPRRAHGWGAKRPIVDSVHRKLRKELLPLAIGRPCPLCGTVMDKTAELDHIIPRADGGKTTRLNCRFLCKRCNHRRGAQLGGQRARQARRGTVRSPLPPSPHW